MLCQSTKPFEMMGFRDYHVNLCVPTRANNEKINDRLAIDNPFWLKPKNRTNRPDKFTLFWNFGFLTRGL